MADVDEERKQSDVTGEDSKSEESTVQIPSYNEMHGVLLQTLELLKGLSKYSAALDNEVPLRPSLMFHNYIMMILRNATLRLSTNPIECVTGAESRP